MPQERYNSILYWAGDLERLARNLTRESAAWSPPDRSGELSREAENAEESRRNEVLWRNAVQAGVVLFKLCGLGAFNGLPRIKNMITHVKAELVRSINKYEVPWDPYSSYDAYFVKMFEGFLKVWPKNHEDQRMFEIYYDHKKERAALHAKLMKELSASLKSQQ